jgi:hypothetical protein
VAPVRPTYGICGSPGSGRHAAASVTAASRSSVGRACVAGLPWSRKLDPGTWSASMGGVRDRSPAPSTPLNAKVLRSQESGADPPERCRRRRRAASTFCSPPGCWRTVFSSSSTLGGGPIAGMGRRPPSSSSPGALAGEGRNPSRLPLCARSSFSRPPGCRATMSSSSWTLGGRRAAVPRPKSRRVRGVRASPPAAARTPAHPWLRTREPSPGTVRERDQDMSL